MSRARPFDADADIFFSKLIADAMQRHDYYKATLVGDHETGQLKLVVEVPLSFLAIGEAAKLLVAAMEKHNSETGPDDKIPF